jgi:hypothetical protein
MIFVGYIYICILYIYTFLLFGGNNIFGYVFGLTVMGRAAGGSLEAKVFFSSLGGDAL